MVADQRHYLTPLPEPRETERRAVLERVADVAGEGDDGDEGDGTPSLF